MYFINHEKELYRIEANKSVVKCILPSCILSVHKGLDFILALDTNGDLWKARSRNSTKITKQENIEKVSQIYVKDDHYAIIDKKNNLWVVCSDRDFLKSSLDWLSWILMGLIGVDLLSLGLYVPKCILPLRRIYFPRNIVPTSIMVEKILH